MELKSAIAIRLPTALAWSPNGRQLAYILAGHRSLDVRVYDTKFDRTRTLVGGAPKPGYMYRNAVDLRWTPDGAELLYGTGDQYWAVRTEGDHPRGVFSAKLIGDLLKLSPDLTQVYFVRDGDLWTQALGEVTPVQITDGERYGIFGERDQWARLQVWPSWSPDSNQIAYMGRMSYGVRVVVAGAKGGLVTRFSPEEDEYSIATVAWSPDSKALAISRLTQDQRRNELVVGWLPAADCNASQRVLWVDRDALWVNHRAGPHFEQAWSPDGSEIAFTSGRSGHRHLYVASVTDGKVRQLTSGPFSVSVVDWSPDGSYILVLSGHNNHQHRSLCVVPASGGELLPVLDRPGICSSPTLWMRSAVWSPDGSRIAFNYSGPDEPFGLWLADVPTTHRRASAHRFYSPIGEDLEPDDVCQMATVEFSSDDGLTIPGLLITARDLDRTVPHPALSFQYGGWGQKAALGWGEGRKSLLFNYLANLGYVVLVTDPRGSEGYGRDFAHAMYLEGGGKQTDDLVSGARFLSGLGYVDPRAIAIFGQAYGGYLAAQTMLSKPGVFAGCIAVGGFFDNTAVGIADTYYTRIRFGAPDQDLQSSRSPIRLVNGLVGAMLVVHGADDYNVPIAESQRFVMALIRAGKDVDYISYPGQPHDLIDADAELDFWKRLVRFLAAHCVPGAPTRPNSSSSQDQSGGGDTNLRR